mmetsp:Transcript_8650/g.14110  ORF Transcript_8650/g.14110 Transcript_8650/m.14110 type:complete len:232 (+) Transcript_8650:211-906(+)
MIDDDKDGEEKDKKDGDKDNSDREKKKDKKKESPIEAPPLVILADKTTATAFSYLLLGQMQPCVFTEGLPTSSAGLACRHCFGEYGSGRFFPSSIKTLGDMSNTLNVLHDHMARCCKVPKEVLEELEVARATHDDERAKMKFGSQKAFFAKIWSRLHDNRPDGAVIKLPARKPRNSNSNGGLSGTLAWENDDSWHGHGHDENGGSRSGGHRSRQRYGRDATEHDGGHEWKW